MQLNNLLELKRCGAPIGEISEPKQIDTAAKLGDPQLIGRQDIGTLLPNPNDVAIEQQSRQCQDIRNEQATQQIPTIELELAEKAEHSTPPDGTSHY
ncbi:hypothetical protein GCM10007989_38160 [Devosia pacifica]|uniref:Uncharacterized protein n=1 Tax=Devosia pacifica TaxID=1335967 RepID=A0A918SFU0_9HYPH|nr:hypothetical protein GCM10007989_38160 [Devosia pacifica]